MFIVKSLKFLLLLEKYQFSSTFLKNAPGFMPIPSESLFYSFSLEINIGQSGITQNLNLISF